MPRRGEQLRLSGHALERMRAAIAEVDPRPVDEIFHGPRHEHLSSLGKGGDACPDLDRDTADVVVARNPSPVCLTSRPWNRAISARVNSSWRSSRSRLWRSPSSAARLVKSTMSVNCSTSPVIDSMSPMAGEWSTPSSSTRRARSSTDRASDYGSEGWEFESLRARSQIAPATGRGFSLAGPRPAALRARARSCVRSPRSRSSGSRPRPSGRPSRRRPRGRARPRSGPLGRRPSSRASRPCAPSP